MTLQEAWQKRKELWANGTVSIEDGNKLWKEISVMPGSVRVGIWYSLSEASAEAALKVATGYTQREAADLIWHDAIIEHKGPKAKLLWTYDDKAKGYSCTLETGEEFKA